MKGGTVFMIRLTVCLLMLVMVFGCGASKSPKKTSKSNSKAMQHQMADAAFDELDVEAKKERPEDLVLDEKPHQIKPTAVPEKKRPTEMSGPKPVAEKKRPTQVSEKSRMDAMNLYPLKNGYPVWFFDPNYDGYLGGVGVAKLNNAQGSVVRQKRLAKMLAQAELAKQVRVVVDTELNLTQTKVSRGIAEYYHSKLSTFSKHQANEVLQSAVVKDQWTNPKDKSLFLWLVIEK